jgi:hypothetical protein
MNEPSRGAFGGHLMSRPRPLSDSVARFAELVKAYSELIEQVLAADQQQMNPQEREAFARRMVEIEYMFRTSDGMVATEIRRVDLSGMPAAGARRLLPFIVSHYPDITELVFKVGVVELDIRARTRVYVTTARGFTVDFRGMARLQKVTVYAYTDKAKALVPTLKFPEGTRIFTNA